MSTTKKLSEDIEDMQLGSMAEDRDYLERDRIADRARALEERVAELEKLALAFVTGPSRADMLADIAIANDLANQRIDAATARAEAAEREILRVHGMLLEVDVQASRAEDAEAEVARLRAGFVPSKVDISSVVNPLMNERDAMRAKLEKVRAKVSDRHGNPIGPIAPAHILGILDGEGSDEN